LRLEKGAVCLPGKIYTSGDFGSLEEAAAAEIRSLKDADRYAEAVVVTGSNLLRLHLRRNLSSLLGGLFNVHFLTFPDLVSFIEMRSGRRERDSLSQLDSIVLLEEITSAKVPACFSEISSTAGFARALHSTFTDLAEGCCGAGEARGLIRSKGPGRDSERVRGVLELYARFRETIEARGGDIHSRFTAAADLAPEALEGCSLYAYGFYDFNELQYRLLAPAMRGSKAAAFIPYCAEGQFGFAGDLVERLVGEGLEHVPVPDAGRPDTDLEIFSASDAVEESREVARRIIEMREVGGPGFGETGVLLWSRSAWPPLREALDEARIPWASRIDANGTDDQVRTAASRLLGILCGDIDRTALVDFLISSPIAIPGEKRSVDDPLSLWVRLSAAEGMRGERGWKEESELLIEKTRRREEKEGGKKGWSDAIEQAAEVIASIEKARDAIEKCRDWRGFSSVFAEALAALFAGAEAEDSVRAIEQLAALDRISASCDAARFRRIAAASLQGGAGRGGVPPGRGVNVMMAEAARGLRFAATFMAGLDEGTVPGRIRQDPFIKDQEREAISKITGKGVRLSLKGRRLQESVMIFRLACASASKRLTCSWPRMETGGSRELSRTSYLRLVKEFAAGVEGDAEAAVRIPLRGRVEGAEVPLGPADYDFLMSGRRIGKVFHYPSTPFFQQSVSMIRGRRETKKFTRYDGVFESPGALVEIDKAMREKGWNLSATSLQSWANCPFAFLVEKLIRIDSVEEPERELTIDPLTRGTLTHLILERLYGELAGDGIFPLTEADLAGAVETAGRIARETLDEFESTQPVGHQLFWEYERDTIERSVRELLVEEVREATESVPSLFEVWFGGGSGVDVGFDAGGRMLSFHGKIDRIDITPEGGFEVIDYKTGRITARDQDLCGGSCLQLPVYLLAASKLLEIPVERGAATLRRVGTAAGRKRAAYSGEGWESDKAEFARILEVIVSGISSGLFFACPAGRGCDYCAVRQACPTGGDRLFSVKAAADRRALDYLDMRGYIVE
jgi:RecB family exonuclease